MFARHSKPYSAAQRAALRFVAGDDKALLETGVAQRAGDRFGHSAAALQRENEIGRKPMLDQQSGDRQVVGVVRFEVSGGVDDGIDRVDRPGRSVELIDQRDAVFLERHRDRAATNSQRPNAADRRRQVGGRKRLVDVIEVERVVEVVMKTRAEIARPRRQRDAQRGVLVDRSAHRMDFTAKTRFEPISPFASTTRGLWPAYDKGAINAGWHRRQENAATIHPDASTDLSPQARQISAAIFLPRTRPECRQPCRR